MNDIYSTMVKLTTDLIEAVFPYEDGEKSSPVSLKCEITRGSLNYCLTNERDSKGNYEITAKSDTEDDAITKEKRAIFNLLDFCFSKPSIIQDIQDGEVTAVEAAMEALQVYSVTPMVLREENSDHASENEKKPRLFEAVKAAGSKGITLTADNIGDFDLSGLEFWTPEAELSLAKVISECLNAPNVMESIKNGTTTTEEAVKDIIATFRDTHEEANKATHKAE